MSEQPARTGETVAQRTRSRGLLKRVWRKVRKPLAESQATKSALASILANALRLVRLTNRIAPESDDIAAAHAQYSPAIIAFWHGQHLMAPTVYPRNSRLVAMVSRSADAELNALVVEKFGLETVRGSGGRQDAQHLDKGGAKALIALKKALDAGSNVCMIADIPHGTPRDAGLGIVTLARLAKKPIIPVAIATSRRKVLPRTWDKTTISLPFGRLATAIGDPVYVPANADLEVLEAKRREVTAALNAATERAYRIVDAPR
ncbi:MAG: lysophospholipid acyltransferase family protein [Rhizobiaceae bacterium]|nr:lysophospholipid acyltransferase family protein [Rhizobiaceae bacterium]